MNTAPRAAFLRALAAAVLGAGLFCVALLSGAARHTTISIVPERAAAYATDGIDGVEHTRWYAFTWTRPAARVTLPGLDRRLAWRWSAIAHSHHPTDQRPTVRIAVDGVVLLTNTMTDDDATLEVVLPLRPGHWGATIDISTTPPFRPGGTDPRELGLALESHTLTAIDGRPGPAPTVLALGALAVFALGVLLAVLSVSWRWTLGSSAAVAAAYAALLLRGTAMVADYPGEMAMLSVGLACGTWLLVAGIEQRTGVPLAPSARGVAALSALVCFVKLAAMLHPGTPSGDTIFHAHRFENVLGGSLFFTSIAPGAYAFPYPVLLYVVSAPLSWFVHDTFGRAALLRIVVTVADAGAGALLYWMIVRGTADRFAGLAAVAWYHAIPMTAWIMAWGNLTNAFGQTLMVTSLATIVALPVTRQRRTITGLACLSAAALLSHPSTCALLAIVLAVTAALYWWSGRPALRETAIGVGTALVASGLTAVVLYYAWFPSVYIRELSRIASNSGTHLAAATPAYPMGARLALIPDLARSQFGWPAVVAALVGAWRMWSERLDARLGYLLGGWATACLVFLAIGVVTPMEMRTYFALFPALAIAAGFASRWAWRGPVALRAAMLALGGVAILLGVEQWIGLLG